MKIKHFLVLSIISIIMLLSGCLETFTYHEGECPTIYGFNITEKDSTGGSSYRNITRSDLSAIPEILTILDILESNQTLKSKEIRLEHERWNTVNEILTNNIFVQLEKNSWYFSFNEQLYEIVSFVIVC